MKSVRCTCPAYAFPHRTFSGKCRGIAAVENRGPKTCGRHEHREDCRPGRPLCRYRRRAGVLKTAICDCDAYHHRHRWGGGRCAGGFPDPVKMYAWVEGGGTPR